MGTTLVEEFVARLGWEVDNKGLSKFQASIDGLAKKVGRVGAVLSGIVGLSPRFIAETNRQTAVTQKLATAVGLSYTTLSALSDIFGSVGISQKQLAKMTGRFSRSLQDVGTKGKEVDKTLQTIGLSRKELSGISEEEGLLKTFDALKNISDEEMASVAAVKLFGRSSEFLVGVLRQEIIPLGELVQLSQDYNLMTDDAVSGAAEFTKSWNRVNLVLKSLKSHLSGMLGQALSPVLEEFTKWFVLNKQFIRVEIVKFVKGVAAAFKVLIPLVIRIAGFILKVIDKFGGLGNILERLLQIWLTLKIISWGTQIWGVTKNVIKLLSKIWDLITAIGIFKSTLIGIGLVAGALIIEDIIAAFTGKKSFLADMLHEMQAVFEQTIGSVADFFSNMFSGVFDSFIGLLSKIANAWVNFVNSTFRKNIAEKMTVPDFIKNWDMRRGVSGSRAVPIPYAQAPATARGPSVFTSPVNVTVPITYVRGPGETDYMPHASIQQIVRQVGVVTEKAVRDGTSGRGK